MIPRNLTMIPSEGEQWGIVRSWLKFTQILWWQFTFWPIEFPIPVWGIRWEIGEFSFQGTLRTAHSTVLCPHCGIGEWDDWKPVMAYWVHLPVEQETFWGLYINLQGLYINLRGLIIGTIYKPSRVGLIYKLARSIYIYIYVFGVWLWNCQVHFEL